MCLINRFIKRIFDVFASCFALLLFLPLFIVIAILIKCDSKGPVFFKQERRTKNGRIFKMYKFRSMIVDAEKTGSGLFNYKDDPRVTRFGRFLRNTSIDELPQLINVVKGDISLVGPRPCVAYELGDFDTLNNRYKKRFVMKGGITGLAQVKGRNDISWDEKVEYDNKYIDLFGKHGVFTDMGILFETVIKVFRKKNIYEEKVDENMSGEESAKKAEEELIRAAHIPDGTDSDNIKDLI